MTLSTVGYGDISAVSDWEVLFSIIVLILATLIYTLIVANLEDIVAAAVHLRVHPARAALRIEERIIEGPSAAPYSWSPAHTRSWRLRLAESLMSGSLLRDVFRSQPVAPL